ncbi:hypothetical protein [Mucilaginibacter sp.]|uniref:hypothetical protein n=1 Tax=Mucilaginibacter sp. TaxID=1882438 RepID=UPI0025DA6BCB|nr:hypothetical protein [Mucilaginibacter sp.]
MKFLCYISALVVLLLTAKPCCADNDCGIKNTITQNAPAKSSPKGKDCQGCSPFFACGSCTGFTVTKAVDHTLFLLPQIPVKHVIAYNQPYTEDVAQAIWQPPQIS